jgi:hypothetical protein
MTRDLILGAAGHIDHGKTALVKALTGVDCDRLPEEKARGITIDIGFASLDLPPTASASSTCPATSASSRTCWPAPPASTWPCSWSPPPTPSRRLLHRDLLAQLEARLLQTLDRLHEREPLMSTHDRRMVQAQQGHVRKGSRETTPHSRTAAG